jgi:hypothetical protein
LGESLKFRRNASLAYSGSKGKKIKNKIKAKSVGELNKQQSFSKLHGVTSRKIVLFIITAVKNSNPTYFLSDGCAVFNFIRGGKPGVAIHALKTTGVGKLRAIISETTAFRDVSFAGTLGFVMVLLSNSWNSWDNISIAPERFLSNPCNFIIHLSSRQAKLL